METTEQENHPLTQPCDVTNENDFCSKFKSHLKMKQESISLSEISKCESNCKNTIEMNEINKDYFTIKLHENELKLYFDIFDDIWHCLLSHKTTLKIYGIIWSYYVLFIFSIALIGFIICKYFIFNPFVFIISNFICVIFWISHIFAHNIPLMKRIITSFDFWYKIANVLIFFIARYFFSHGF